MIAALALGAATIASARWEVVRSDQGGLVVRWSTSAISLDTIQTEDRVTFRVMVEDAVTSGEVGAPALPFVSRLIALPEGMDAVATARVGLTDAYEGWLAPVPREELSERGLGYSRVYAIDRNAYALAEQPERVRIEDAGALSGLRLVRLVLAPVRFDPSERVIGVARSITVTVRFVGAPTTTPSGSGIPELWRDAVLNFDQARTWVKPHVRARLAADGGFFGYATWMRLYVRNSGIHYLTAASVIATDARFRDAPLDRVAMFSGPGRELPISPVAKRPHRFQTVRPLVVDANGDGKFNGSDSLLFYGKGPSGWHQNMGGRYEMFYETNRYTTENVYWLGIIDTTARHAEIIDGTVTDPNAEPITRFAFRYHEEIEWRNFDEQGGPDSDGLLSGLDWEWETLPAQQTRTIQPVLYDMAGDTVVFRVAHLRRISGSLFIFTVTINGAEATNFGYSDYGLFGTYQESRGVVPASDQLSLPIAIANTALLDPNNPQSSTAHLDFTELHYWRRLNVRSEGLAFTVPPGRYVGPDRPAELFLTGIDRSKHRLFEVTDSVGLVEYLLPPANGQGITHVQVSQSGLLERRFLVTSRAEWRQPVRTEPAYPTANLRGRTAGVDYVVVTHPSFVSEARRLADWRATQDGFRTAVVTTRDIYDEFSFGLFDPAAIRDFLRYAWENWRDGPDDKGLQYVLLMGDGQYDFRNLSRAYSDPDDLQPGNWVPTYQEGVVMTDDWFGVFETGIVPSVRIGRLCVQTLDEAAAAVNKVIAYESQPERGSWQNRVVMIADDEFNPDYNRNSETEFVRDSEALVRRLRRETVARKLYSFQYPMNEQRLRPGANRAIVEAWNEGCVLLNYIGHGSPIGWAHERIFMLDDQLPDISNGKRLPVLTALTCSAAHFDDPKRQSMAEVLTNLGRGGVIASIATTRLVFNRDNVSFTGELLDSLFRGGERRPTIGDAFWRAKEIALTSYDSGYRDNSRRFVLIGDPATRVALPELPVQVRVDADSLAALGPVTVRGSVLTLDGQETLRSFDGRALIHLLDSETPGLWRAQSGATVPYARVGATMFRGMTSVSNGEFSIDAILPREVVYGGQAACAVVQVWNDQIDGAGSRDSLAISTSIAPGDTDAKGPTILFTRAGDPDDREPLADGTEIAPEEPVRVWLSDASGINVTGAIGHRLLAYINEERDAPRDLTGDFVHWGSATSGWADIALPKDGRPKRLIVEAWDNRNNFAADSVFVRIGKAGDIALRNVIAYPNPMADQTTFTWIAEGIGNDTRADATVRIYTVAGRLVDTVTLTDISDGPVLVPWRPARQLANGVYLYQITVRRRTDGTTARTIERVAVVSP